MSFLYYILLGLVLTFGLVVFVGAPYLPTLKPGVEEAIRLTGLKRGQTLLELGSGDGRVLLAAAKQGIHATGYELNPILVVWSKLITWRYRRLVVVKWGNYWLAKWPETDAIYVFLLQKYMKKLDNKIVQTYFVPHRNCSINHKHHLATGAGRSSGRCPSCGVNLRKNIRLVSLAFTVPGKKPKEQVGGLFLYIYT